MTGNVRKLALDVGLYWLLPIQILDPIDISNAIVWLVSDEARAVTGITLPVDAGVTCP